VPNAVFFAIVAVAITTVAVKATVVGRRFEAIGANPAGRATG
jgi:ribose transport system permease protein